MFPSTSQCSLTLNGAMLEKENQTLDRRNSAMWMQHSWRITARFRGRHGEHIGAITLHFTGVPDPRTAEAWGLWQAMNWTSDLRLSNVNIEADCKRIVDAIFHECKGLLDFHSIISNCNAYLSQFPNSLVSFSKRQANHVAHSLTRASRFYDSCHTFNHVQSCIASITVSYTHLTLPTN